MIILLKLINDETSSSFTDLNKKIKRGFFMLEERIEGKWIVVFIGCSFERNCRRDAGSHCS